MYRIGIKIVFLFLFVSMFLTSCEDNSIVQVKDSLQQDDVSQGQLHNEILAAFNEMHPLTGKKLSRNEFTKTFILVTNDVYKNHGLSFRINEEYVNIMFSKFDEIKRECGYDFYQIGGSDLETALDYLERKGKITHDQCEVYKAVWRDLETWDIDSDSRSILSALPVEALNMEAVEIAGYSYEFWEAYIAEHPELEGWWEKWRGVIRDISIIGGDYLGCVLAGPGCAAGAALGSIAFILIWTVIP